MLNDALQIPTSLDEALNPQWLQGALAEMSGEPAVKWVGDIDKLETVAAKVRFAVRFAEDGNKHRYCLKAFLNPAFAQRAGITAVREALFYRRIAPHLSLRAPRASSIIDIEGNRAILIMEDLIHAGARFCSALEPFSAEQAAQTLDQIARLHAGSALLELNDWIPSRLAFLATAPHFKAPELQQIMDGPRGVPLTVRTRDAALLLNGMKVLAERFVDSPMTILHGDCHAGNFYMTPEGPGLTDWQLVQRGNWAQDVAYHIAAVLPAEVAEREERRLLAHYLDRLQVHGGQAPVAERAWEDYRAAQIYGFYHWAITVRVEPEITNTFVERLGKGVERHDSYRLLGL